MEKTNLYAYIRFVGEDEVDDFPLEVVTERLGVQPTDTWRIGDKINCHHPRNWQFICWKYSTETLETMDADDVLHPILNVFQSN